MLADLDRFMLPALSGAIEFLAHKWISDSQYRRARNRLAEEI